MRLRGSICACWGWLLIGDVEMKLVVAAVYSNFTTEVADAAEEDMEQVDFYIAGPVGGKCVLRFRRV